MRSAVGQVQPWKQSSCLFCFSACCACCRGVAPLESAALYQLLFRKFVLLNTLCKIQGVLDYQHDAHLRLLWSVALGLLLPCRQPGGYLHANIAWVSDARERKTHTGSWSAVAFARKCLFSLPWDGSCLSGLCWQNFEARFSNLSAFLCFPLLFPTC